MVNPYSENMDQNRKYFYSTLFFVLVIIIGVTVVSVLHPSGTVTIQLDDEDMGVGGSTQPVFLTYDSIISAELVTEWEAGSLIDGFESDSVYNGSFQNSLYEEYSLFIHRDISSYIVIVHSDGVLVFNDASVKKTEKCYEELCTYLTE